MKRKNSYQKRSYEKMTEMTQSANLGMFTHETTNTGRISWGTERVEVEIKRFNDRAFNRDLETLCAKVTQGQPHLPDGRPISFHLQGTGILHLDAQEKVMA